MSLKPLARKGLGVLTAVSAGVLALGAAPAAADITSATANCPGGGDMIGGVNNGSGTTGSVGPTLSGLLSGSGTGLTKAGDLGSAAAQPCHVVSHS
ncbi:hypothetical protein [Nocardia tengchongensis]|uniref:hypothetical protein n=1 Tax=Nocardia tengchongensis TaxID=2055889 RepID=UPI00364BEB46